MTPEPVFRSCIVKVKVTCIRFINNLLFAGVGGNILIYERTGGEFVLKEEKNVFSHNIYGIQPDGSNENVVVYGKKQLSVFPIYSKVWNTKSVWEAKDWIWHVRWMDGNCLAIITGHNEVIALNWHDKTVLNHAGCEEKCLLYSALIIGSEWNEIVVLAGTVYKEIVIWVPSCTGEGSSSVIHRLKGHNGVIFSVNYDFVTQRICSTSDDRTVRVWHIVDPESDGTFMRMPLKLEQWRRAVINPSFTVFGHSARVWRSCMISQERVISIGEDSFLCVWDSKGTNVLKQETHQGGRLCCVDFNENLHLAATGGADGGISLWAIPDEERVIVEPVLLVPPKDPARIVTASKQIIVTSRSGSVIACSQNEWKTVLQDERIVNYCLMEISPCCRLVALATIQGFVIIVKENNDLDLSIVVDQKVVDGKVFSLNWLTSSLLLCCGSKGTLTILNFNDQSGEISSSLELERELTLPFSRERWVTSAVLHNNTLVCGDRGGSIHVFSLTQGNPMDPIQTFYKVHGRLGVSCLNYFCGHFWSAGRDSTVKQFSLDEDANKLELVSVEKLPIAWTAKIIFTDRLGVLVLGFHEVDLVVWSLRFRVMLWRLECGGGHREWSCHLHEDKLHFYYLKHKAVHYMSKSLRDIVCPTLLDGFHTREVNALCILPSDELPTVVISGGEDTHVRISFVEENIWRSMTVLCGHLSSVRAIATFTLKDEEGAYLIFTAGGRAQLKVWKLKVEYGSKDKSPMVKSSELCSHLLRGVEAVKRPWREALPSVDPETRYMDLSVHASDHNDISQHAVVVFAACSDGYLRMFNYIIGTNKLESISMFEYHNRCLLRVFGFELRNDLVVVTTATDGKVAFWNIHNEKPFSVLDRHQSGINSCDFARLHDDRFLLATGGDDCAVSLSVIQIGSNFKLKVLSETWKNAELHCSQVSGVKISGNLIFTAGVDQRINLLTWKAIGNTQLDVRVVSQYCTFVPDVHGISVAFSDSQYVYTLYVYGVGVEVLHVCRRSISKHLPGS